ncbi:MAG TPA: leucyl aminopeptidase [Solirubrobacteraceae bacterium]|nr:leucyl aminopeptidase [Solirubrobacteraceae bacterium]
MNVRATTDAPADTGADTIVVGVFEGEGVAHDADGAPLTALLESGEARRAFKHLALAHSDGLRRLLIGLGERGAFDAERARVAAATALHRARELGSAALCWEAPHGAGADVVAGIVEGTVLAAYRYDRLRSSPPEQGAGPAQLVISAHEDVSAAVKRAAIAAEHCNRARDLQHAPANELTPIALGAHAQAIEGVEVEVAGRERIEALGMGALLAVARGSEQEPALITMRYEPPQPSSAPLLALVGKGVTFDSGGISIKSRTGMWKMKQDMSGGAAVIEAIAAIARLRLPIRVLGVVGATENMPSGGAYKAGDVVTAMDGTTIEIVDTDAEGRLVLADCVTHAVRLGAGRIVDVATLTGAVATALGTTYAGLMSDDDGLAAALSAAGERTGELVWRLPLHAEYEEATKGTIADLANTSEPRVAGAIYGATFVRHFAAGVPWAHLDIAGTAWDTGRAYAPKGPTGFGVRLLVALAQGLA